VIKATKREMTFSAADQRARVVDLIARMPERGEQASGGAALRHLGIAGGAGIAAADIVLPDPGPQITAQSTGSGDAGSITASANPLLISNRAAISTEARTSTASGGNITLHLRDFLYLTSSEISTSVKGETGSGGNINTRSSARHPRSQQHHRAGDRGSWRQLHDHYRPVHPVSRQHHLGHITTGHFRY
jgi:hypothetical protein